MRKDYLIIGVLLFTALVHHRCTAERPYPPNIVRAEPVQESTAVPAFQFNHFTIQPLAKFEVKALVLSSKRYFLEQGSKLVPVDLALGWGPMSDQNVLKDLKISQGNRWYFYTYREIPIPDGEIIAHSANMHLIPATPAIAAKIKQARVHDIVEFKGFLVNVTAEDGWRWRSSQSRTDTGGGSCELVWVSEFETLDQ